MKKNICMLLCLDYVYNLSWSLFEDMFYIIDYILFIILAVLDYLECND